MTVGSTWKKEDKLVYNGKLHLLSDYLIDSLPSIFDTFGHTYKYNFSYYSLACPIHIGNNRNALQVYGPNGKHPGRWRCVTKGCQDVYKSTPLGLVRGLLNSQGRTENTFDDAVKWSLSFIGTTWDKLEFNAELAEKRNFVRRQSFQSSTEPVGYLDRSCIKNKWCCAPELFVERGFSPDLLRRYDICECKDPSKKCFRRVVIPIYDRSGQSLIGYSARSIFPECPICELHHAIGTKCPETDYEIYLGAKWHHSANFPSSNSFYNLWEAEPHIRKSKTIILTEGPLDCLKLVSHAILNTVAIFGIELSYGQMDILDSLGVMNLVILLDNDEAGINGTKRIIKKCQRLYRMFTPLISVNDPGEMSGDMVSKEIEPLLAQIYRATRL